MKTFTAIIIAIILLAMSISTGSVFAEGGGGTAYPVETETTTVPTPEPTKPTPEPTRPTPEPTQPPPVAAADTPDPTDEPDGPHPVCEDGLVHPVLSRIAEVFDVPYEALVVYFCEYDFGVGEIVLLLETYQRSDGQVTLEELLAMRVEQELGWGEIWQALGLKGRDKDAPGGQGETGALNRNHNRRSYNNQASSHKDDGHPAQSHKPDVPPGQEKDKNTGKPDGSPSESGD